MVRFEVVQDLSIASDASLCGKIGRESVSERGAASALLGLENAQSAEPPEGDGSSPGCRADPVQKARQFNGLALLPWLAALYSFYILPLR